MERKKKIPVKRRVLLRQAYVTIKIGPKMGWNFAAHYMSCKAEEVTEADILEWSNPLASRPNHKSSIHHEISLQRYEQISGQEPERSNPGL